MEYLGCRSDKMKMKKKTREISALSQQYNTCSSFNQIYRDYIEPEIIIIVF